MMIALTLTHHDQQGKIIQGTLKPKRQTRGDDWFADVVNVFNEIVNWVQIIIKAAVGIKADVDEMQKMKPPPSMH